METSGLFHLRLPNGEYAVRYNAAYVYNIVEYTAGNRYVGSAFVPVQVPEQIFTFSIADEDPIVVWMPDMLYLD